MRNTARLMDYDGEEIEVDLDKVVSIGKNREGPHGIYMNLRGEFSTYVIPAVAGMTGEELREALIDRWRHGHGRPEIIEVFSDTEGPKHGFGRELLDLSACVTFSCCPRVMWGPEIVCRFASKEAQSQVFFLKRDESVTADEQCANVETLWRKARGEANV